MSSSDCELHNISEQLKHVSLKRHQLLEKKKIHSLFQEMRGRAEFRQKEKEGSNQTEIYTIDEKLSELTEKKAELQKSLENILDVKEQKNGNNDVTPPSSPKTDPTPPFTSDVIYVEPPPNIPAPKVYLDLEDLPTSPCRTQCPECREYVMTETYTSTSSVTWLVCFMTAMMGCVAGCCFIPFCVDKFKSTTHKCPLCRTRIQTVKQL